MAAIAAHISGNCGCYTVAVYILGIVAAIAVHISRTYFWELGLLLLYIFLGIVADIAVYILGIVSAIAVHISSNCGCYIFVYSRNCGCYTVAV